MYDVYISMRHTPLSMYYLGWIEKFLSFSGVKIDGMGITADILKKEGLKILSEKDFEG